ncbi:MAG: hypothetical protein WCI04_00765 [archaeon]
MFSAIVAIILVMTGTVLTNTLISTEEKTSRQVYSMLNNYALSDEANLARSDALQSFNYNFREKLENYLTFNDSKKNEPGFELFRIDSPGKQFDFASMKKNFEAVILLTDTNAGEKFDAAISYVADRTVDQFLGGTYGRFSVSLSDVSQDAKNAIKNATKSAIEAQRDNFLEVVDCGEVECKNGSFYFNIPLNKISNEAYESLPRIVVKDLVSQEEIKMAILPRTNIKVYIPLRFFKALNEARKTANAISASHAELAEYKLGFCESASCAPRTNQITPMSASSWNKACPISGFDPPIDFTGISAAEMQLLGVTSYLAGGAIPGWGELKAMGASVICKKAISGNAFITDDANFTVNDDLLYPGDQRNTPISNCGLNNLVVVVNPEGTHILSSGERLRCSRITGVIADIVYAETNPLFIVKGTAEAGKKDLYKIRITESTFAQQNQSTFTSTALPNCVSTGSSTLGSCDPI